MTASMHDRRTHGIAGTYAFGCRCNPCTDGWREYARRYARQRRIRYLTFKLAAEQLADSNPELFALCQEAAREQVAAELARDGGL